MSSAIWINTRDGDRYESDQSDHSAMLALDESLDILAAQLGVPALSSFYDDTDLRYNIDESGEFEESDNGWPASVAKWFNAADALHSVEAILTYLRTHAKAIDAHQRWTQADVEIDLLACKAELERAVAEGKSIHFCIVM